MSFVAVGPVMQQLDNLHIKLICKRRRQCSQSIVASSSRLINNEQEIFQLLSSYYRSYSYWQPEYAVALRDNDGMKTTQKINLR